MTITLCYWDARGLGEIPRYLLRYSGETWTDDRIPLTKEGMARWRAEKYNLGLDLPNLPYLVDGDIKITHSIAIIRYLGRKFGLMPGDNVHDVVKCEMVEQEATDLHTAYLDLCLDVENFKEKAPAYLANLEKKLEVLDKYIGVGPFVLGEKLTYVDFMVFEFVSRIQKFAVDQVTKAGNIVRLLERFKELPQLQDYFSSDEFKNNVQTNNYSPTFISEQWLKLQND